MNDAPRRMSTLAIISFVSGLLGWTLLPGVGSIVAIVTGHLARGEIQRDPQGVEGDAFAITGLVLGWIFVGLLGIALVLTAIVFFGGIAALAALAALAGAH